MNCRGKNVMQLHVHEILAIGNRNFHIKIENDLKEFERHSIPHFFKSQKSTCLSHVIRTREIFCTEVLTFLDSCVCTCVGVTMSTCGCSVYRNKANRNMRIFLPLFIQSDYSNSLDIRNIQIIFFEIQSNITFLRQEVMFSEDLLNKR